MNKIRQYQDNNKRDTLPDVLKGIAVILVVFGHCMQEVNGTIYSDGHMYFDNKIYQLIYSFHMPLFMLITGYFSYRSIARGQTIGDKCKAFIWRAGGFLFPVFIWTVLDVIRGYIIAAKDGIVYIAPKNLLARFWDMMYSNLWFLWAAAICLLVAFIVHTFLKDNVIVYGLLYLSLFFIPDDNNMHVYKYMLPFFIVGFYFKKWKDNRVDTKETLITRLCDTTDLKSVLILGVAFVGLFLIYRQQALIYVGGYYFRNASPVKMIALDVYRTVIGFVGSFFIIKLTAYILSITKNYRWPVLSLLGRYSLGMYIIQAYYIILVFKPIFANESFSIVRTLLITLIVLIVTLLTSVIIGYIPGLRRIIGKKGRKTISH